MRARTMLRSGGGTFIPAAANWSTRESENTTSRIDSNKKLKHHRPYICVDRTGELKLRLSSLREDNAGEFELKSRQLPSLEPMVGACVGGVARQMESVQSRRSLALGECRCASGGTAGKGRARFEACITQYISFGL